MSEQPQLPIRIRRIGLEGDYAGFWIEVRINVPLGVLTGLEEVKENAELFALLAQIGRSSNFVDDNGRAIDVSQANEWPRVALDLMHEVIRVWKLAIKDPFGRTSSTPPSSPTSFTAAPLPSVT